MSVWFKSRLNPWYIWIPSNPNLYSTKIIMKMRWQTIASNVSIRTISPTATPLPKAYDCVAVYIAGRRTSLVVYGWWPQPPTKNEIRHNANTTVSQIPECICSTSHNSPFRTEMSTFLLGMEQGGIWNRCILGFVNKADFLFAVGTTVCQHTRCGITPSRGATGDYKIGICQLSGFGVWNCTLSTMNGFFKTHFILIKLSPWEK